MALIEQILCPRSKKPRGTQKKSPGTSRAIGSTDEKPGRAAAGPVYQRIGTWKPLAKIASGKVVAQALP